MENAENTWLDEYAVTCGVFRGRWSIRHCLRMYTHMKELRIQASSRAGGRVVRHESRYNPCAHCAKLTRYLDEAGEVLQYDTARDFHREGVCA
jgi:hypothetical protein